jgi:signal transduction histidine kinase
MGWANIKNRVEFLKGKLNISSLQGKGTSVTVELAVA